MQIAYGAVELTARVLAAVAGLRLAAHGVDRVPGTGPAIVVANHVSYLDPFAVGLAVRAAGRWPRYLAKRELFDNPVAGPVLRHLRHVPVDREGARGDALRAAEALLRAGELVVVFPEGTISTAFVPTRPRLGAARLALATGAPLVPAACWGGQRVLSKRSPARGLAGVRVHRPWGVHVSATFGAPLAPTAWEDAEALMARAWAKVRALVEHAQQCYPQC
jgi:1-acyl-sn-glycerol-3-phosphate acyltransferase